MTRAVVEKRENTESPKTDDVTMMHTLATLYQLRYQFLAIKPAHVEVLQTPETAQKVLIDYLQENEENLVSIEQLLGKQKIGNENINAALAALYWSDIKELIEVENGNTRGMKISQAITAKLSLCYEALVIFSDQKEDAQKKRYSLNEKEQKQALNTPVVQYYIHCLQCIVNFAVHYLTGKAESDSRAKLGKQVNKSIQLLTTLYNTAIKLGVFAQVRIQKSPSVAPLNNHSKENTQIKKGASSSASSSSESASASPYGTFLQNFITSQKVAEDYAALAQKEPLFVRWLKRKGHYSQREAQIDALNIVLNYAAQQKDDVIRGKIAYATVLLFDNLLDKEAEKKKMHFQSRFHTIIKGAQQAKKEGSLSLSYKDPENPTQSFIGYRERLEQIALQQKHLAANTYPSHEFYHEKVFSAFNVAFANEGAIAALVPETHPVRAEVIKIIQDLKAAIPELMAEKKQEEHKQYQHTKGKY